MRLVRAVIVAGLLAACCMGKENPSLEPWLPITQQDLAIKEAPGLPGASALQLYVSAYRNDSDRYSSVYRRIKILTEAGKKYADVEIELKPGELLIDLRARTIHPDGTIFELKDKPFQKTVFKGRGVKYVAKTFTFPNVSVGSIIEYSYDVNLGEEITNLIDFPLQGSLYTVKERYRFHPFTGEAYDEWASSVVRPRANCVYAAAPDAPQPRQNKDGVIELELGDLTPLQTEENMPPVSSYLTTIFCFYTEKQSSPDEFWQDRQKRITARTEKWLGKSSAIRQAAVDAIGSEQDPEKKLRKLYDRAQQIRNLSFEHERTEQERKQEKLKAAGSAEDVLRRGYGTHWEIDGLFVALARAAGFDASMLGMSDRHEVTFNKIFMSVGELGGIAVAVPVNGEDVVLDPGTRFCPYGLLPWRYTAAPALKFQPGGGFVTTPQPATSFVHRTADLKLSPDGIAKGEITLELSGQEALDHRLDALNQDQAGRAEGFENEIKSWFTGNPTVKLVDSHGWDTDTEPLTVKFAVEIPGFAAIAGTRLVIPAALAPTPLKAMFSPGSRDYPILLPYPFAEHDQIKLQVPDGYAIEAPPSHRKASLAYADYEISSNTAENQLVIDRSFRFGQFSFSPEQYGLLKNFFRVVEGGDSSQGMLRRTAATASSSASE